MANLKYHLDILRKFSLFLMILVFILLLSGCKRNINNTSSGSNISENNFVIANSENMFLMCVADCENNTNYGPSDRKYCLEVCYELNEKFPLENKKYKSAERCEEDVNKMLNRSVEILNKYNNWCDNKTIHPFFRKACKNAVQSFYSGMSIHNICLPADIAKKESLPAIPLNQPHSIKTNSTNDYNTKASPNHINSNTTIAKDNSKNIKIESRSTNQSDIKKPKDSSKKSDNSKESKEPAVSKTNANSKDNTSPKVSSKKPDLKAEPANSNTKTTPSSTSPNVLNSKESSNNSNAKPLKKDVKHGTEPKIANEKIDIVDDNKPKAANIPEQVNKSNSSQNNKNSSSTKANNSNATSSNNDAAKTNSTKSKQLPTPSVPNSNKKQSTGNNGTQSQNMPPKISTQQNVEAIEKKDEREVNIDNEFSRFLKPNISESKMADSKEKEASEKELKDDYENQLPTVLPPLPSKP